MARKPTELRPLMIRIPESLRGRLEREATRQDRSMNAIIIERLDQSFLPESLRGKLEKEATRQGKSTDAIIIERLERSFFIPGLENLIPGLEKATANATAVLEKFTVVGGAMPQNPTNVVPKRRDEGEKS